MRELSSSHSDLESEPKQHWRRIKQMSAYLWPANRLDLKIRVVLALSCLVLAKALSSVTPIIYRDLVNRLNVSPLDGASSASLVLLSLLFGYGFAKFSQVAFGELRDFVFVKVAQETKRRIALETFEHLHALPLSYHLDRQTGGLSRVIERGTSAIQFILSFMLFSIVPTFLELLFVTGLLSYYFSWLYALVTFMTLSLYVIFTLLCTEWRLKFRREMNQQDEIANTKAIDSLLNFETVKYFGNEAFEFDRFDRSLRGYEQAATKSQGSLSFLNCGQNLLITTGTVVLMYMAILDVQRGAQDIGSFVMLGNYMMQLFLPLNFLGFVYRQMKQSLIDLDRLFDIKDQPLAESATLASDCQKPIEVSKTVNAEVEFKALRFSYNEDREVLAGIDLLVPSGKTLAIVGATGSGKSTIARLLFRFYEPSSGAILINGRNIAQMPSSKLRQLIGVVPQDPVLFNDTIGYNIRYGRLDASDAELMEAARGADIADFILSLKDGLQTRVGERGLKVSGGEKQRIAIARTILKDPPILVFDEASSALDSETERVIQASFERLSKKKTSIVIAHRLSTIQNADEIIVLKGGQIFERGQHDELLAKNGLYKELWAAQESTKKSDD